MYDIVFNNANKTYVFLIHCSGGGSDYQIIAILVMQSDCTIFDFCRNRAPFSP